MDAYDELQELLENDEEVEAIVFGPWGWGSAPREGEAWELEFWEPDPPPVPFDVRGQWMPLPDAEPYMRGWSFYGGYGSPECYAVYIWTSTRVFWVTQYDGSTGLNSAPRHPMDVVPDMPGG